MKQSVTQDSRKTEYIHCVSKNVPPLQLAIILHTQFDCVNLWHK